MLPTQKLLPGHSVTLPQVFQNALLSNIAEAVIATDKSLTILTWNKAAEKIYGIKARHALNKKTSEVFNYEYVNTSREEAWHTLVKNHFWKGVVKHTRKDGRVVTLEASVTEVISDTNEVIGFVAVNRDITDYEKLRLSLHSFSHSLANLGEGVYIVDKSFKLVYANNKAQKTMLAVYGKALVVGKSLLLQLPTEKRKIVGERFKQTFQGETFHVDFFLEKGDESFIALRKKYYPIKDENGHIVNVGTVLKNVTKEKIEEHIQEKLRRDKEAFEKFMDNSPLVAWIADEDGRMQYMNRLFLKTFKLSKKYIGTHINDLFPKKVADKYLENNAATLLKGECINTIEEAILPNGDVRIYKVSKFPIYISGKVLIGGWAIDISEDLTNLKYLSGK